MNNSKTNRVKNRRNYSHVFFDLDNTLWDFKENSFHALHSAFNCFSISAQNIDYMQFFGSFSKHNQFLWQEYRQKHIVRKKLMLLRFQKTFNELNIQGINAGAMNSCYLEEMPKQKKLIDGCVEILDSLKSKGYSLFIITNGFREVQNKKLEETNLKKYFTKVFVSETIKSAKPGREIFEFAVKSANARKVNSLMVGDDFFVDVTGALAFGMDAVYFNPHRIKKSQTGMYKPARHSLYVIYHLKDLNKVV